MAHSARLQHTVLTTRLCIANTPHSSYKYVPAVESDPSMYDKQSYKYQTAMWAASQHTSWASSVLPGDTALTLYTADVTSTWWVAAFLWTLHCKCAYSMTVSTRAVNKQLRLWSSECQLAFTHSKLHSNCLHIHSMLHNNGPCLIIQQVIGR